MSDFYVHAEIPPGTEHLTVQIRRADGAELIRRIPLGRLKIAKVFSKEVAELVDFLAEGLPVG